MGQQREGLIEGREEGLMKGREEGREEGIRGTVSVLRELGIPVQTKKYLYNVRI